MLIKNSSFYKKVGMILGILPSFLKIIIYKSSGAKIGRGVKIGFGSAVIGERIEIGDYSSIAMFTLIRGREIKIGRYVNIGSQTVIDTEIIKIDDDAKINEQVFIGGLSSPDSLLKMGKRTIIMKMSFINTTKPVLIGDDTGIGGHCLLFTHGSWQSKIDGYPVTFAPITLGKNVWLPWRVFIMPGVTIGDGCTIGADSLVTKDIPPGCLAAGSPAKILRTPEEYPKKLSFEEKNDTIAKILSEYFSYLQYHKLAVKIITELPYLHSRITKDNDEYDLFYLHSNLNDAIINAINENCIFLSLIKITEENRNKLSEKKAMWADLETKERKGSNNIGEETVKYLSRYGIRFNRMD